MLGGGGGTRMWLSLSLCSIWLSVTSQTVACQAPLSMGFSKQEYWNGCYFLLKGIFSNISTLNKFPSETPENRLSTHKGINLQTKTKTTQKIS